MTDETPDEQAAAPSDEPTDELSSASAEHQTEDDSAPEASTETTDDAEEEEDDSQKGSLLVTPEELKEIRADPKLAKLYRSLNKGYTEKSQANAARVKEAQAALQFLEGYKQDPAGAIAFLQKQAGIAGGQQSAAPDADVQQQIIALFGDEVGPKVAEVVQKLVDSRTSGLSKTVESTVNDIKVSASQAALATFRETHKDLSEVIAHDSEGNPITIEGRMVELATEFVPAKPMDTQKYLARFYDMAKREVSAKVQAAKLAKDIVTRTNSSAASSKSPGSPTAAQVALQFPTGKGAFKRAFEMAKRDQRAG